MWLPLRSWLVLIVLMSLGVTACPGLGPCRRVAGHRVVAGVRAIGLHAGSLSSVAGRTAAAGGRGRSRRSPPQRAAQAPQPPLTAVARRSGRRG
jgi:hypothetical protein